LLFVFNRRKSTAFFLIMQQKRKNLQSRVHFLRKNLHLTVQFLRNCRCVAVQAPVRSQPETRLCHRVFSAGNKAGVLNDSK